MEICTRATRCTSGRYTRAQKTTKADPRGGDESAVHDKRDVLIAIFTERKRKKEVKKLQVHGDLGWQGRSPVAIASSGYI